MSNNENDPVTEPTPDDDGRDVLREHSFDGIQEYDNDVPQWMTILFVLCCLWGAAYLGYFMFGPGKTGPEAHLAERTRLLEEMAAKGGGLPPEELLRQYSRDETRIALGKELYLSTKSQCTVCHGENGLGQVGPNLRDDMWKYGSDMTDIYETIANGRNQNAMPLAKDRFSPEEMINIAVYVANWNRTAKNNNGVNIEGEVEAPIAY